MNRKLPRKTGLYYLSILTVLLMISESVFKLIAESEIEETAVKVLIVGLPLIFVLLGFKWARWVASLILIINGSITLVAVYELNSRGLYIVGLYNIFFAIVLHFSKKIRSYFDKHNVLHEETFVETKPNDSEDIDYPYLLTRYKAALIDGLLQFSLFAVLMILIKDPENRPMAFIIFLIISLLYEPIFLTVLSGTIGHKMMKIKIKTIHNTSKNINLFQGLVRIFSKIILGWLSFLTINFNAEHRAIHDYLSSSIVLNDQKKHNRCNE